mmetsp:Transcript_1919/g.3044  ORF Transcript_1919/g.3044 Transcript_1919/m.3044 type:complete len:239 (-) Transcript_1919:423-1139(-)
MSTPIHTYKLGYGGALKCSIETRSTSVLFTAFTNWLARGLRFIESSIVKYRLIWAVTVVPTKSKSTIGMRRPNISNVCSACMRRSRHGASLFHCTAKRGRERKCWKNICSCTSAPYFWTTILPVGIIIAIDKMAAVINTTPYTRSAAVLLLDPDCCDDSVMSIQPRVMIMTLIYCPKLNNLLKSVLPTTSPNTSCKLLHTISIGIGKYCTANDFKKRNEKDSITITKCQYNGILGENI